jgi:hypothetical protein
MPQLIITDEAKKQALDQLLDLGFPLDLAQLALVRTRYEVNRAAEMLVQGGRYCAMNLRCYLYDVFVVMHRCVGKRQRVRSS